MKFLKIVILLLSLLIASSIAALSAKSFIFFSLKGNGHVIKQKRDLKPFTSLEINGIFDVELTQGDKECVTVETDENLQEIVQTENNNSKLTIKWKQDTEAIKPTKMKIYITLKNIDYLSKDGVGNIITTNNLVLQDIKILNNGVGDVTLGVICKKLDMDISSVGTTKLKGDADETIITNTGNDNIKAIDFISQKLHLINMGIGNAELNVQKELNIESLGKGNVYYKGSAKVVNLVNSGTGKIKHLKK